MTATDSSAAEGGPAEPGGALPPLVVGSALRRAEAGLRLALAIAWLALALGATTSAGGMALRWALAGAALLAAGGLFVRATTLVGTALALVLAAALLPWGALLLGAAGVHLALLGDEERRWLAAVRRLERRRGCALAATELARARSREGESQALRGVALADAGDAYERAGELRGALEALGAEASRLGALVRPLSAAAARLMRPAPSWRRRLEQRLLRRAGPLGGSV